MTAFSTALSATMRIAVARGEAANGPGVDTTLLPAAEGRAIAAQTNLFWNTDLPAMAQVGEVLVPADAALGSAACRMRVLVPEKARPGLLMFVHGGGFAFCSPETHERCARVLAVESGLPVVLPDYRLSPEHPFPAGLLDVVACLRGALGAVLSSPAKFAVQPGPVIIGGDSAGANLALCAVLHEQQLARPLPTGALLFYGVYGADFTTESYRQFVDGPGLSTGKMQRYWDWYCPPDRRETPLAVPLLADDVAMSGLPPLYMMAAGIDPLLSDTLLLVERLRAAGRDQAVTIVPGILHGALQMTHSLPEARTVLAEAGAAARRMSEAGL